MRETQRSGQKRHIDSVQPSAFLKRQSCVRQSHDVPTMVQIEVQTNWSSDDVVEELETGVVQKEHRLLRTQLRFTVNVTAVYT